MALRFNAPQKTDAQLRSLAASGSTSFAKAAQAELQARMTAALRRARAL